MREPGHASRPSPVALQPLFPRVTARVPSVKVSTPWVTFPGLYTAQCEQDGGASWLQVTSHAVPGDPRPVVADNPVLGPIGATTWTT